MFGGLPVRNFSAGRQAESADFKMGGDFIGELNTSRGGEQTHACMPGLCIECSNVYHDAAGKEKVSPVEYETLGLLGTNCYSSDPDDLADLNYIANDLGIDTIEAGATLAVLMEAGLAEFGDTKWMTEALAEIAAGSEKVAMGAGNRPCRRTLRCQAHPGRSKSKPSVPTTRVSSKARASPSWSPHRVQTTRLATLPVSRPKKWA